MESIFARIRRAFAKPAPIWPNVSAAQYDIDRTREAVNVVRSMGRRVQIAQYRLSIYAEDWGDIKTAEEAASRCAIILNTQGHTFKDRPVEEVLDELADRIMGELGIPADRHLGCCFVVVEPG